jgi:hypothetical protein
MKFKDLFKTKDNTSYEVRASASKPYYTDKYSVIDTDIYIVEYMPKPRHTIVFINKPWYQKTQRYIVNFL